MGSPGPSGVCAKGSDLNVSENVVATHNEVLNHLVKRQLLLKPNADLPKFKKCSYSDYVIYPPTSIIAIGLLDNFDFWTYFHVTRDRAESILNMVNEASAETEPWALKSLVTNQKVVLLCLWYLRHPDATLSDALRLFDMPSVTMVKASLERGYYLLSSLKDKVIKWPSRGLYPAVSRDMEQKYKIVNCIGSLGHNKLLARNGEKNMVQVICNKVYKFAAVNVTKNIETPLNELFHSDIKSKLLSVPTDYFVLGSKEYGEYFHDELLLSTYHIRTTLQDVSGENSELRQQIKKLMENTIKIVNLTITETTDRFPRLLNLYGENDTNIITSAAVIQNLCYDDTPPFIFDK